MFKSSWSSLRRQGLRLALFAAGLVVPHLVASLLEAAELMKVASGHHATAVYLLNGTIASGDLLKLQALVSETPQNHRKVIIMNSVGGDLSEGLRLGRYFHEQAIATFVLDKGGICYSACALAFLGGRDALSGRPMRVKPAGGHLGFHQFARANLDPHKIYTRDDLNQQVADAQRVTLAIIHYLKEIKEDLGKLQLMLRAPNHSMNVVADDDCLARGIHVIDARGQLIEANSARTKVSLR